MSDTSDRPERDVLGELQAIFEADRSGRPLPWKPRYVDELSALSALARVARDWREFELLYFRAFPAPRFRGEGPEYDGHGCGEWT